MPAQSYLTYVPSIVAAACLSLTSTLSVAQGSTSMAVAVDAKQATTLSPATTTLDVNGRSTPLVSLQPLAPEATQVALLIDDGLRSSLGRQFTDIQKFLTSLKPGVEVMVGYMQNGRVVAAQPFTTNHAAAAEKLRLPFGSPGISASPYICLSDLARSWPREEAAYGVAARSNEKKTRFVLMLTNGVDPYNGSVSPLNQNSPYVDTAVRDAQRAGIAVYSIYYPNTGVGGGAASFSGQNYLSEIAEGTGGLALNPLRGTPPSISPYFNTFLQALDRTYIAGFDAPASKTLASAKFKTSAQGVKLRAARQVQLSGGEPN